MANPTPKSVIHHNPEEIDNMRFLKKKRYTIPAVIAAGVLAMAGTAFGFFSASGSGGGGVGVGTASGLLIDQTPGTPVYNSLIDGNAYQWSLSGYSAGAELGNAIDLASTPMVCSATSSWRSRISIKARSRRPPLSTSTPGKPRNLCRFDCDGHPDVHARRDDHGVHGDTTHLRHRKRQRRVRQLHVRPRQR